MLGEGGVSKERACDGVGLHKGLISEFWVLARDSEVSYIGNTGKMLGILSLRG